MSRLISIVVAIALLLCGCGGSGTSSSSTRPTVPAESSDRTYVAAADRVCAGMIAESRRMGARLARQPNPGLRALTVTTRELVAPALPIIERSARKLRAVEREADSLALESYVSLYDPIVALIRTRVEAGEEGDAIRAHELELQMVDLSTVQRRLAREAGLRTCDVDFIRTFAVGGAAG